MRRQGWIVVVLGLGLTCAAHAQQTEKQQSKEAGTAEPKTDAQALERQSKTDQMQEQASERLSRVEEQGIELSALDEEQVKTLQQSLQDAGYYSGRIDGTAGGATKQALSRFYRDQAELASRGKILPQAAAAVGLQEADIEQVSGEDEDSQQGAQPNRQPSAPQEQPQTAPQEQPSAPQEQPSAPREQPNTRQPQTAPQQPQTAPQHEPMP